MIRANRNLIARETALPGLGLLLDPEGLAETLGCGPLQLDYLRLKSGTSCLAAYRSGTGWLIAKSVTMDRVKELRAGSGLDGLPHRVLPDLAVQVMPAAADRRMRGLAEALDPCNLPGFLADLRRIGIRADRLVTLKLKPQRRLVARLERGGQPVGFLKIHSRDRFADALIAATLSQLVHGPRLLHADARTGLILTEWLAGQGLDDSPDPDHFTRAGRHLARLHASTLPMPIRATRQDDLAAVEAVIDDCASLLPELADRLAALWPRLQGTLLSQPVTSGLIHGDFSADQVLVADDRIRLIDWDRSAIGDQGGDIGCFLARLDKDVLDGQLDPAMAADRRRRFLDGYAAAAPLPPSGAPQHLRHLALLLTEDFRHQRSDWDRRIGALLTRIEQGLSDLPQPLLAAPDPALPALADALHAPRMAPLLERARFTPTAPPQLSRHKPGRRAMIRYDASPQPLLAKMQRKGLDRRTIRLQRALRAAGFDGSPPLRVEVPEVVITDAGLGLWAMPQLAGEMLDPRHHDARAFFDSGAALAHLHQCPVTIERDWTLQDEADVLTRALHDAVRTRPEDAGALHDISGKAARMIAACPLSEPVLLHRDFYPDQLLVAPDRIVLLDLDLAARGEAAVDLGNFLAHLQELGLRHHADMAAHDTCARAFLAGYASIRPLPPNDVLDCLREVSLWRHLFICQRFPDRRGYFDRLLQHAVTYPDPHSSIPPQAPL